MLWGNAGSGRVPKQHLKENAFALNPSDRRPGILQVLLPAREFYRARCNGMTYARALKGRVLYRIKC